MTTVAKMLLVLMVSSRLPEAEAGRPQHAAPPMEKRGALALVNARSFGQPAHGVLRSLVHAVNDTTNKEYVKEVQLMLKTVWNRRLPFDSDKDKDRAIAMILDEMRYIQQTPLGRGQKVFHGFCHIFPEFKNALPLSWRVVHSWNDEGKSWEGSSASSQCIFAMILDMITHGDVVAGIATWNALDGYLRGQDWKMLRKEDVFSIQKHKGSGVRVAQMFGRRHRGESVKTGQEQGVDIDDECLAMLIHEYCKDLADSDKLYDISEVEYRHAWDSAQRRLKLQWVGPPHTLRHTKPSEDSANGTRSVDEIQKRGRWTQAKSMQRYSKPHALTIHLSRLPGNIREIGDDVMANKDKLLAAVPGKHPWGRAAATTRKWLLAQGSSRANSLRDALSNKKAKADSRRLM